MLPLLAAGRPGGHLVARRAAGPDRARPARVFADRRITDSSMADDPLAALRPRAEDYAPGDTDLAWTRTTAVAGAPRLRARHGVRPPRRAGRRARAAGSRATRQRDRAAARRLAVRRAAAVAIDVDGERPQAPGRAASSPSSSSWTRRRRCGSTPTGTAARSSPSPSSRTPRWRCPSASSATCSPRSCAGSTPTSPTRRARGGDRRHRAGRPPPDARARLVRPGRPDGNGDGSAGRGKRAEPRRRPRPARRATA